MGNKRKSQGASENRQNQMNKSEKESMNTEKESPKTENGSLKTEEYLTNPEEYLTKEAPETVKRLEMENAKFKEEVLKESAKLKENVLKDLKDNAKFKEDYLKENARLMEDVAKFKRGNDQIHAIAAEATKCMKAWQAKHDAVVKVKDQLIKDSEAKDRQINQIFDRVRKEMAEKTEFQNKLMAQEEVTKSLQKQVEQLHNHNRKRLMMEKITKETAEVQERPPPSPPPVRIDFSDKSKCKLTPTT
jgi:hypothetical protein